MEAIGLGPRRPAPHRGAARAASAHGTKRRHRPPTPRRHSGGRARLAHRRSPQCSQKSGDRPTKTRSFCAITPRFLRRGGSAAEKTEKQRETTDAIAERTKTLTSHRRTISKNTFSRRAHPGKCRPKFARFVGLGGNRGRSIHFISSIPERKTKKESTTHRRLRRKLCIFTLRPTHFVHSSNDCPRRRSKSTICPFASWGTMGKNTRFGCAIPHFLCKSDDKNRLFHLRRPLIPF